MKKSVILLVLLMTPTLLYARINKNQVVGKWTLTSKQHYLILDFNRKGFVNITEGDKKHKPQKLPLGIWSTVDDSLKITIYGKVKFHYTHIRFKGKTISVHNRHGKIERFHYIPPARYRSSP